MSGFDFKFEVDSATAYLENAGRALQILTDTLDCEMRIMIRDNIPVSAERVLEFCAALFAVEHELQHVNDELSAAVTEEYKRRKEVQS